MTLKIALNNIIHNVSTMSAPDKIVLGFLCVTIFITFLIGLDKFFPNKLRTWR